MKKYYIFLAIKLFFLILITSCSNKESSQLDIKINKKADSISITENELPNEEPPIIFAISAMLSPEANFNTYKDFIDYLSEKINRKFQLKQRKTYEEVNRLLEKGEVDIALICSGAYVAIENKIPLEILVIPSIDNYTYYHSYIIVNKSSNIKNFADLKGKSFAFTDPLSNSGYLYCQTRLNEIRETDKDYFSKTIFTNAHDQSIQAVARGNVDAACVDGLIYKYFNKFNQEKVKDIEIIEVSDPFGIPPIVIHKSFDLSLKQKIKTLLLKMHKDRQKGKKILSKMNIDRFVESENTNYTSIRKNYNMIKK